jgi:hypothetical protein
MIRTRTYAVVCMVADLEQVDLDSPREVAMRTGSGTTNAHRKSLDSIQGRDADFLE